MHSRSATAAAASRAARVATMTPDARVQLAVRLGEQGLEAFMSAHNLARGAAIARIKATRRLGRPHSACAEADEH
jgi:hypothetical protein